MASDSTIIKFCSYNSQGHGAGRTDYIRELCQTNDFVLLQEHWYHDSQASVFETEIENISSHFTSGMEAGVLLEGRPYGGCAVLWSNIRIAEVQPVSVNSRRICGITTNLNGLNTLICSVYMPCLHRQNATEFRDVLAELAILCCSSNLDSIIIGGDFNLDVKNCKTDQSCALKDFLNTHNLKSVLSRKCYSSNLY